MPSNVMQNSLIINSINNAACVVFCSPGFKMLSAGGTGEDLQYLVRENVELVTHAFPPSVLPFTVTRFCLLWADGLITVTDLT